MKLARMPDGGPEIFHSVQGEGRSTGRPSVFVRASLCNLHCFWCDTDYTWNWEGADFAHERDADPAYRKFRRQEEIVDLSTDEVVDFVGRFDCSRFVFTGGEPLLQERAWVELMDALTERDPDAHYEIETNGTRCPGDAFLERIHRLNVSPKLANSRVPERLRHEPDVLRRLAATGLADFKFVVGGPDDLDEALAMVEEAHLPADRVFLMPQASSPEELERHSETVASLARRHGFHFSDRLHLRLYGPKRGV